MKGDRDTPTINAATDDVEVLDKQPAYSGYFRLDRYRLRHRLYTGGWSPPIEREVFERGHGVCVILYDVDRDLLVLIEQFRIGAFAAGREPGPKVVSSPWLIELVAGIIDEGETAEEVARREAMEEAGCEITHLERICLIFTSSGGSSETVEFYLGLTHAPETGGIRGLDDEHEDIRVLVASPDEVWRWIDAGCIVDGRALVGLQWFRIRETYLRARMRSHSTE